MCLTHDVLELTEQTVMRSLGNNEGGGCRVQTISVFECNKKEDEYNLFLIFFGYIN